MALRNQPYIPLYVQDYLTDEKLSMCSWATQEFILSFYAYFTSQSHMGQFCLSKTTSNTLILLRILLQK